MSQIVVNKEKAVYAVSKKNYRELFYYGRNQGSAYKEGPDLPGSAGAPGPLLLPEAPLRGGKPPGSGFKWKFVGNSREKSLTFWKTYGKISKLIVSGKLRV